jgi:hypothetical protein
MQKKHQMRGILATPKAGTAHLKFPHSERQSGARVGARISESGRLPPDKFQPTEIVRPGERRKRCAR